MIAISECPICKGRDLKKHIECIDYTVSKKSFPLLKCDQCNFLITSPRPENLGEYYQSEDYISHSEKAKGLFGKTYELARNYSTNWKIDLIKKSTGKDKIKILDYGCGTGSFLEQCLKKSFEVRGVEPSDNARQIASRKINQEVRSSLTEINEKFDVITLWHVLEHIPDLNEIASKLREHLHNDGLIIIAVPNHESWDALHYKKVWAAYDVPRHLWHFSQTSIKRFLGNNGFNLVNTIPMKLDSFYVSMLSEKYIKGTMNIFSSLKGVLNGLKSNVNSGKEKNYSSLIYIGRKS